MTDASTTPRRRWWLILLALVTVPVLLFTLYLGAALKWSYSDGERAGVLQKFSRRGWVWKTCEGELARAGVPGCAHNIWEFSGRDEAGGPKLNAALGRRVEFVGVVEGDRGPQAAALVPGHADRLAAEFLFSDEQFGLEALRDDDVLLRFLGR